MKESKSTVYISAIVAIACASMFIVDGVISPPYFVKSLLKLILFAGLPMLYCRVDKNIELIDYFKWKKSGKYEKLLHLGLGLGVYVFLLGGFFVLKNFIDLDQISQQLSKNVSVNKDNFIFVAIYISFINSFLEEFFFRGFTFLSFLKLGKKSYAYTISALAFSLYHVALIAGWFPWFLSILALTGLFAAGLLFNWLNSKSKNIYYSWVVHLCANLAINTVGFIMYGII